MHQSSSVALFLTYFCVCVKLSVIWLNLSKLFIILHLIIIIVMQNQQFLKAKHSLLTPPFTNLLFVNKRAKAQKKQNSFHSSPDFIKCNQFLTYYSDKDDFALAYLWRCDFRTSFLNIKVIWLDIHFRASFQCALF